ncbi:hypothetical protein NKH57_20405 [Mesorhizobium sp. M1050]
MAVANVGFIAALAGKRVLLMDWDLEAPGLAVYFRGVTEHEASGNIRKAHGVLNLFTKWRDGLLSAAKSDQVSEIFKLFASGAPFKECVRPLLPTARLPKGGKLDIIGAGSAMVGELDPLPYPEALARFHWPSFFAEFAGGAMLDSLRTWARRNYDMILIDSRTGLADVAGICTMQMPDEVVLCFVLNRQNTEGVADIAASIRAARGDEVKIRLSPMRVSKDRPTEEADARARAHREIRNAGLDPQRIEYDMAKLSIAAAPNIPFYETLAPFAAASATADPLTFEYLRMTQELTNVAFDAPRVEPAWIESVRRRLQPRMTTVDYLNTLETADPDRAYEELERFLDGALDADPSRELDADYVEALVSAAFDVSDWFTDDETERERPVLAEKALLLLRQLHEIGEGDWRVMLVDALDNYDVRWGGFSARTNDKGNIERDAILAAGHQSPSIVIQRAHLRVQNVRSRPDNSFEQSEVELRDAESLLNQIAGPIQPEEIERAALEQADIAAYRAEAFAREPSLGSAVEQWRRVLDLLERPASPRGRRLLAEAHLGLAISLEGSPEAVEHVLSAARLSRSSVLRDAKQFARACAIVVNGPDAEVQSVAFAIAAFAREKETRLFPLRSGVVSGGDAILFAKELEQLAVAMGSDEPRRSEALAAIAEGAEQQLHRFSRTRAGASDRAAASFGKIIAAYSSLSETLAVAGASNRAIASLQKRIEFSRQRPHRPIT